MLQYFIYIVAVSAIDGVPGVPGENHRPAASHGETLSYDVVLSTLHLSEIRTHNVSGDKQLGTTPLISVLHVINKSKIQAS
jgi:hypothetical protein